ncbi:MAG: hypothetical protein AB8C84_11595 [Oligoflexales bacterium]
MSIWNKKNKASIKINKDFHLQLSKNHHDSGFSLLSIENISKKEKIYIEEDIIQKLENFLDRSKDIITNGKIFHNGKIYLSCSQDNDDSNFFILKNEYHSKYGFISLQQQMIPGFISVLNDHRLKTHHDTLTKIINYHRLFQFTFEDQQESMNSDLSMRRNILSHLTQYTPRIKQQTGKELLQKSVAHIQDYKNTSELKNNQTHNKFQSKLGVRSANSPYEIDYNHLLQSSSHPGKNPLKKEEHFDPESSISYYPIQLTSSTIKQYQHKPYECDISSEEMKNIKNHFISHNKFDFFLGFEMMQAIFKKDKKQKSFVFPLYYMKVEINHIDNTLQIKPIENGRYYLNYIAIINLIETFSRNQSKDDFESFFNGLLQHRFEVDQKENRLNLSRTLPVKEEFFKKYRDYLLGDIEKDDQKGIFSDLKIAGVECDVEDVYLYRTQNHLSIASQCLNLDLGFIEELSEKQKNKFNSSLLGKFLDKKLAKIEKNQEKNSIAWMPGALPQSMKNLNKKIKEHDLLVLQGPPGTGKTHTIRNILIDALCHDKKIMIVSDRGSAIEAVMDKMESYFLQHTNDEFNKKIIQNFWRRCIPCIPELSQDPSQLRTFIKTIVDQLFLKNSDTYDHIDSDIKNLDKEFEQLELKRKKMRDELDFILKNQITSSPHDFIGSANRKGQPTNKEDIDQIMIFKIFLDKKIKDKEEGSQEYLKGQEVLSSFIQRLCEIQKGIFHEFYIFFHINKEKDLFLLEKFCDTIEQIKPETCDDLIECLEDLDNTFLTKLFSKKFNQKQPPDAGVFQTIPLKIRRKFKYPLYDFITKLQLYIKEHKLFLDIIRNEDSSIWNESLKIYDFFHKSSKRELFPFSLELIFYKSALKEKLKYKEHKSYQKTPHYILNELKILQDRKDSIILEKSILKLQHIADKLDHTSEKDSQPLKSKILYLCDQISEKENLSLCIPLLQDLQKHLIQSFPVWVCRKQAIPFLIPCQSQVVDLIIIDEATQCRVDDSLPLLMRAKKIMVVGDDKQTVLNKNSIIDDYLFNELNLKEHLASTQSANLKGGGSHIFGLLKDIQQAEILLDEHYRCPPDIISYSNEYVYHNQLKIMQWEKESQHESVHIDYSEKDFPLGKRQVAGPYKGLDTGMIDRFLDYVCNEIEKIEKQKGIKVNVETDVALCYFLLKNNSYFDDIKSKFLTRLNRGHSILSGAGAALQGKERDYIFYFWDCYRGNFASFKQGDDENKRKGELNVLMSRPKKKAYHFLHHSFQDLAHSKSSITDYLWSRYQKKFDISEKKTYQVRQQHPGESYPQNRGSGQLMLSLIQPAYSQLIAQTSCQFSKHVGNPRYQVDLILENKDPHKKSLCFKDLSQFLYHDTSVDEVIDYFFQLQRAQPSLNPVFCFLHHFLDTDGDVVAEIKEFLNDSL